MAQQRKPRIFPGSGKSDDFVVLENSAVGNGHPNAIRWNPDGSEFYVLFENAEVAALPAVDAWDMGVGDEHVGSISPLDVGDVSGQMSAAEGLDFADGGSKMYVTDGGENVHEFNLSTPYRPSTASFVQSWAAFGSPAPGVVVKEDGSKAAVVEGGTNISVYEMSTPYDIGTASFQSSMGVGNEMSQASGISIADGGLSVYAINEDQGIIVKYRLDSAWDFQWYSPLGWYPVVDWADSGGELTACGVYARDGGYGLWYTASLNGQSNVFQA